MSKQKQLCPVSFKVSSAMMARIIEEQNIEYRSLADMAKLLIAEALSDRAAKRNIEKLL